MTTSNIIKMTTITPSIGPAIIPALISSCDWPEIKIKNSPALVTVAQDDKNVLLLFMISRQCHNNHKVMQKGLKAGNARGAVRLLETNMEGTPDYIQIYYSSPSAEFSPKPSSVFEFGD